MLKNLIPRLYQQTILGTAVKHNTLTVLPTGLGKTAIAILLAAHRLTKFPDSKVLMLAPTKPLCDQHQASFQKHFDIPKEKIEVFTGAVKPDKRAELWGESKVIISTPQGLENDLINNRISMENVSAIIFDECHHATGDYSYVWLADRYHKTAKNPKILGLTASPGADLEKIQEICFNLKIDKVEVRTNKDSDVKPYIKKTEVEWIELIFPDELKKVHNELKLVTKKRINAINQLGNSLPSNINKSQLLKSQRILQSKIGKGDAEFDTYKTISLLAEILKVDHALELLECQGIITAQSYLLKILQEGQNGKSKAVRNLIVDPNFKSAKILIDSLVKRGIQHPKIVKLNQLIMQEVLDDPETKIIVFTNFRDSAKEISDNFDRLKIKNRIFVGQTKKNGLGLTQKKQKEVLDQFRAGDFQVLVATSVAEEGLDIPKVNQVIFYEPTASAIRNIQRRGRTGRLDEGNVKVLLIKGTRDEGYRWASFHKENNMYKILDKLKSDVKYLINEKESQSFSQANLGDFDSSKLKESSKVPKSENKNSIRTSNPEINEDQQNITILADHREKDNKVIKELINLNISVKTTQLDSADYIVSGSVGVELKKTADFVDSLLDGRLMRQIKELKQNFKKSLVIIEGEGDIYSQRRVNPNAIRGALSSIVLSFNVPILHTKCPKDTAELLAVMAKQEQIGSSGSSSLRDYSMHTNKPQSINEQQEYAVSALPIVGPGLSRKLLSHFGSLKNLVNSTGDELNSLKGIGKKTSKTLIDFFNEKYSKK